ncbi:MAG: class I SAM-dependent methyltransferase [Rhodospirillales bacterium]|nr:class I SAM-dependent methyltransferase [Rhodospirillales bacterium]
MTSQTETLLPTPLSFAWRPIAKGMARRAAYGSIHLSLPGMAGVTIQHRLPGPAAELEVRSPRLLWRIRRRGVVGFAESYMAGECNTPDLRAVMEWAIVNEASLVPVLKGGFSNRLSTLGHRLRPNTRSGSRRNIRRHYDLSNAFYGAWLDPTMTYSSALFEGDFSRPLEDAQNAKYARIAEMAEIEPHHHVLEVGCGWGGFAIRSASTIGCRVTAITISRAQYDATCAHVSAAGLDDRIDVRLVDYRDIDGQFDRIVSIEMMEAVGERFWPVYARALHDRLTPGGRAVLQVITIHEDMFETYRRRADFIQTYIFPGGMLPTPSRIEAAGRDVGLDCTAIHSFGADYAETLRRWRHAFEEAWPSIESASFDERFRRMWLYYLTYCEVGFDTGRINVGLFALDRS